MRGIPSRLVPVVVLVAASMAVLAERSTTAQVPGSERPPFETWLSAVREEALARGLAAATLDLAFAGLEPSPTIVERDRTQAETVLTLEQYVDRRLTRAFVRTAAARLASNRTMLARVAARYHVQPRFIVAVWGMESNFGRFSGVRPIVQALVTLAWEGRREALFKRELFAALEILERGYIDKPAMKGSWAGAMGQTQFMPTSYLAFAEDFDGDGRRDIWASRADVFASIANYLQAHGWKDTETWGREVRLPTGGWRGMVEATGLRETGCRAYREMTVARPMDEWRRLGVRSANGAPLPRVTRDASLVTAGRRTFIVYGNYESLLEYNCAHTYALTVGLLADRIR